MDFERMSGAVYKERAPSRAYCNYCTVQLCIASSESSNMSFMSAVRVVEYLDSAITAAVELVAVRGCPADEGGHGTGHVTLHT